MQSAGFGSTVFRTHFPDGLEEVVARQELITENCFCVVNGRRGARGGLSAPEAVRPVAGADKPPLAPVQ